LQSDPLGSDAPLRRLGGELGFHRHPPIGGGEPCWLALSDTHLFPYSVNT
jgi:hypothetical protein